MKKICTVTAALLVITLSLPAQEKNFIDQNYIEITASAEKEVSPNEIYISITIDEKDNKNNSLEKSFIAEQYSPISISKIYLSNFND